MNPHILANKTAIPITLAIFTPVFNCPTIPGYCNPQRIKQLKW
jgi:hypothetical protein